MDKNTRWARQPCIYDLSPWSMNEKSVRHIKIESFLTYAYFHRYFNEHE